MELDALPPRVLRDMVRDVIEQHTSEATHALRMLFDEYRRGSSLDEIVVGQMWCAGLFQVAQKTSSVTITRTNRAGVA